MSGALAAGEYSMGALHHQRHWGTDNLRTSSGLKCRLDDPSGCMPGLPPTNSTPHSAWASRAGSAAWKEQLADEEDDEAQGEVVAEGELQGQHEGEHEGSTMWETQHQDHQPSSSQQQPSSANGTGGGGGTSSGLTGSPASEEEDDHTLRLDVGTPRAGRRAHNSGLNTLMDGDSGEHHDHVLLYRPKSLLHLEQQLFDCDPGGSSAQHHSYPVMDCNYPGGDQASAPGSNSTHGAFHSFHDRAHSTVKVEGYSENKDGFVSRMGISRQLSSTGAGAATAGAAVSPLHKSQRERGLVAALGLARGDPSRGGSSSAASHSGMYGFGKGGEGFRGSGAIVPQQGIDDKNAVSSFRSGGTVDSEDDRRQKRMLSNRESARRSRQRKQRKVEEMKDQASQLAAQNADMAFKCEKATKSLHQLNRENRVLRSHAMELSRSLQRLNYMASMHGHSQHPSAHPMASPWPSGAHDLSLSMVPPPYPPAYPPPPVPPLSPLHSDPYSSGYGYMGIDHGRSTSPYHPPYSSLDYPGSVGLDAPGAGGVGDLDRADEGRMLGWGGGHGSYGGAAHSQPYWAPPRLPGDVDGTGFASKGSSVAHRKSPPALSLFPGRLDLH